MAKSVAGAKPIRLFASPWSAPAWMKSNNAFSGQGYLLQEYYQVWADYFVRLPATYEYIKLCKCYKQRLTLASWTFIRFFEEYKRFGLDFWGVTAQNEPNGL